MAVSLIYPPRCLGCGELVERDFGLCGSCWRDTPFIGGTVCESCGCPLPGEADGFRIDCDECMEMGRPWQQGRAALLYSGTARRLVLALKHGDRPELARPASMWMQRSGAALLTPDVVVAPVPLHWTRLLRRRYNQSALLAQAVAGRCRLDYCPDLLIRTRRTSSLDGQSRAERFETLSDAISVSGKAQQSLQGRAVVLVDDVMTSGATLSACSDACLAAGAAEIRVLTLARAVRA